MKSSSYCSTSGQCSGQGRAPVARCRPHTSQRVFTVAHVASSVSSSQAPVLEVLTADDNYANLCSNMGDVLHRPLSGYAGRWSRYKGPSLSEPLEDGDIIYGFRCKEGQPNVTQVWKAEEGDLNSAKLQSQRASLPQLQKDPLQAQLDMDTLVVEVSADAPLLQPSFGSVPADKLAATMKTLAVPDTGNLVVTGALPTITDSASHQHRLQADTKGHPPASKSWFNRFYLRAPGSAPGSSKRWSVMLHYNTTTGDMLTHYHTWEAAVQPAPTTLQELFTPGAHRELVLREMDRHHSNRSLSDSRALLAHLAAHEAHYTCKTLEYTQNGHQCSMAITHGTQPDSSGASQGSSSSSSSGSAGTGEGGPEVVEVWYDSGCYFRAATSLNPAVVQGKDVVFEVGAVLPLGQQHANGHGGAAAAAGGSLGAQAGVGGLVRWLVCYSSTGSMRLKWARNELFAV